MKRKRDPLTELPPPFCGEAFLEALADFEAQRKLHRKPIGPIGRKRIYRRLAAMGEERATAALGWSAECEYQGVFEPPPERSNGYHPSSKASRTQEAFAAARRH